MLDISVVVPCGPYRTPEVREQFLTELFTGFYQQTLIPKEIVLVDDAAHISEKFVEKLREYEIDLNYIKNPWNLGEVSSRNIATALAKNDWIFQASDDDIPEVDCLSTCAQAAAGYNFDTMGYYYVPLEHDGELQTAPGAHALYHRYLWAYLGGYPLCGGIGLADIAFIDLVMVYGKKVIPVAQKSLYWHRKHETNQVALQSDIRRWYARESANENTRTWKHPDWVKGFGYA